MQFKKKQFVVQFDPETVTPAALVKAAALGGKFQSRRDGPVRSRFEATALKLEAVSSKGAYGKKAKGALQLVLTPENTKVVRSGDLVISAPESVALAKTSIELKKPLSKAKAFVIKFKIGKKAKPGLYSVVVKVTYKVKTGPKTEEAHEAEIRVPVFVNQDVRR